MDTCKSSRPNQIVCITIDFLVMVSVDEMFSSIQPTSNVLELVVREEGEVTKMVDCIVMVNNRIPVVNQRLVHILNGGERTITVSNNVIVTPMGVRSKVNHIIPFSGPGGDRTHFLGIKSPLLDHLSF